MHDITRFSLYKIHDGVLRMTKIIETESRMGVARGSGRRDWGLLFHGLEFQFHHMKRVVELDGGDICRTS